MLMEFKKIVLHPYFFLVFILLFMYKENIHQLEFTSILIPLIVSLLLVFVLFYLADKLIKDQWKTGIFISLLVLFFFNYGRLLDARDSPPHIDAWVWKSVMLLFVLFLGVACYYYLSKKLNITSKSKTKILIIFLFLVLGFFFFRKQVPALLSSLHPLKALYFITDHQILLLSFVGLFFVGLFFWFKFKDKRDYSSVNYYANFFSLVLVILVSLQIGFYALSNQETSLQQDYMLLSFNRELAEKNNGNFPDIYYIILDGYAGQKTLEEDYVFDNSYFLSELEKRGFYIAEESRSNYLVTFLSLSSSLNMDYIDFLTETPGEDSKDRTIPYYLMDYSNVAKNLKGLGYRYLHLSSGWAATEDNPFADKVYDVFKLNEFQFVFLRSTPLRLLMPNERATTINYAFEKLQEIPLEEGPKFVFAHIEAPHPPYVFDRDGTIIANEMYDPSGKQWTIKDDYVEQLQYVNKKTIEVVGAIVSKSERPPLIIIHGDHGTDVSFDWWNNPTKEGLDQRSYILNAYYLPNGGATKLYPSISPVNTFRAIFNYYFNQNYKLLDDKTYFSHPNKSPYKFVKVYENGNYVAPYPEQEHENQEIFSQKQWWVKDE